MANFLLSGLIVLLFSGALAAGPAVAAPKQKPPTAEGPAIQTTSKGLFRIEYLTNAGRYNIGKGMVGIVVREADGRAVAGAELTVIQTDLYTRENIIPKPSMITDKGNGLYIVSGLDPGKKDRWELSVTVNAKGRKDGAKFIFPSR